ncbi:MAG TPA: hypothetical protein VKP30_05940 [Polyangiaceae bacterium]|nr:hypothetical protein [Polyangiaceae bacterium]
MGTTVGLTLVVPPLGSGGLAVELVPPLLAPVFELRLLTLGFEPPLTVVFDPPTPDFTPPVLVREFEPPTLTFAPPVLAREVWLPVLTLETEPPESVALVELPGSSVW